MLTFTSRKNLFGYVLFIVFVFLTCSAEAQIQRTFTPRFSDAVNGDFIMIANNMVSQHPTLAYTGESDNHFINSVYVDIDTDPTTFNSSSARLSNPSPSSACISIRKAYLYWAAANKEYGPDAFGNITGNGGTEINWPSNQVKLMLPGASTYTSLTADEMIYDGRPAHFVNDPYTAVKDITALVQGLPNPYGTYQVANVKATEGTLFSHDGGNTGTSGGWQIVFIYESPQLKRRNITIFDGYANITQTANSFDILFDGFQTVPNGPVNANMLIGSFEGDRGISGDQLQILDTNGNWTPLSTTQRDANNFFNSKISINGTQFLDRVPASTNTLGYDAALFELQNNGNMLIDNDQTSAMVRMTSNQETYGLYLLGLSVEVFEPSLGALNFTTNVVGSTFDPGDTAPVEIRVKNVGNDNIRNLEIALTLPPQVEFSNTEPLPPGVTYTYNAGTRELRFFVQDGYTDINDPEYELDFNLLVNHECVTCSAAIAIQAMATFTGETNPATVGTLSSGTVDACGVGNHDPTYLYVIPVLSIGDAPATEGSAISFGISSSHLLAEDATLNLGYTNVSTDPADYTQLSSYTVPTGTGNTVLNIPTHDDLFIEPVETFELRITSTNPITISDNTAIGSIFDNDGGTGTGIEFDATEVTVNEDAGTATFTVRLNGDIAGGFTLDYATTDGTAVSPGDYTPTSGQLTFLGTNGETHDIVVPIIDDLFIEEIEVYELHLSNLSTQLISINTPIATGNIVNNDGGTGTGIDLDNTDVTVNEGDGTATFTVRLSGNIPGGFTLDYTTVDSSAISPGDYTPTTGQLTFLGNDGEAHDIVVPIIDDQLIEEIELYELFLWNLSTQLISINTPIGTGTIIDNDGGTGTGIDLDRTDVTVDEGAGTATFTVRLSGNIPGGFTLDYTTVDSSAISPGDYTPTTGQLTFLGNDGETHDIVVPIIDDSIIEVTEVYELFLWNLSTQLISINTPIGTGTIIDNDGGTGTGIDFERTDVTVDEGAGTATFTVRLTGTVPGGFTLDYTTLDGSAVAPGDYTTTSGQLTFLGNDGETHDIVVPIIDDLLIEVTEGYSVNLSNLSTTLIGINTPAANGNIIDNDGGTGTGIDFERTDVTVDEGAGTATFTVRLTGKIAGGFTLDYTTLDGSAVAPGDYTTTSGQLTFLGNDGETHDIVVPIIDDLLIEATEGYSVHLSNLSTTLIGINTPAANGTITDNDGGMGTGIDFEHTDVTVDEGSGTATFTVRLTGNVPGGFTLDYSTADGSAGSPDDYTAISGQLTFAGTDGEMHDIVVSIIDDGLLEPTEAYTVNLSNLSITSIAINTPQAIGTIIDNDMRTIMTDEYTEEYTLSCGDGIPEAPELTFSGGCGDYQVEFTELTEASESSDDFMIVRTWNVTDSCGNTATFEQIIFFMQLEEAIISLTACTADEPIDLITYLPENFDTNGTFTVTEGDASLNGSTFDPSTVDPGEYLISYSSSEGLCTYTGQLAINVNSDCVDCTEEDVMVSTALTPNGDGFNDVFTISGGEDCLFTFDLMIFNRWGKKVYEMQDYQNDWGGSSPNGSFGKSGHLPTGTYYYIITIKDRIDLKPINGYIYLGTK